MSEEGESDLLVLPMAMEEYAINSRNGAEPDSSFGDFDFWYVVYRSCHRPISHAYFHRLNKFLDIPLEPGSDGTFNGNILLDEPSTSSVDNIDSIHDPDIQMDIEAFVASLFEPDPSPIPPPIPEHGGGASLWAHGDPLSVDSHSEWNLSATSTSTDPLFSSDFDTLITDPDIWSLFA